MVTRKECTECKESKTLDCFSKQSKGKDTLRNQCSSCCNDRRRKWRSLNKDKTREHLNKWAVSNPEKIRLIKSRSGIKCKFGICEEDYNRMNQEQGGKCLICSSVSHDRKLSVDHCHENNIIRGLLCVKCNSMLGFANDSVETLKNAIAYLEKPRPNAKKITGMILRKQQQTARELIQYLQDAATPAL